MGGCLCKWESAKKLTCNSMNVKALSVVSAHLYVFVCLAMNQIKFKGLYILMQVVGWSIIFYLVNTGSTAIKDTC